jgi:hypothetical protein
VAGFSCYIRLFTAPENADFNCARYVTILLNDAIMLRIERKNRKGKAGESQRRKATGLKPKNRL